MSYSNMTARKKKSKIQRPNQFIKDFSLFIKIQKVEN